MRYLSHQKHQRHRRGHVMGMIIRWLVLLVCLAGLIHVGLWIAQHSGEVQMDVHGYRITTHVGVALALVACTVVAVHMLYGAVHWLFTWRSRKKQKRSVYHYDQAINSMTSYIVALGCRDMRAAKNHSAALQRHLGKDAPLTLLLKAHLAVKQQNQAEMAQAFEALQAHPTTAMLAHHQLSVLAYQQGDAQRAMYLARQAYEVQPHLYDVVKHYIGMCLAHEDKQSAQRALLHAMRHHVFDAQEAGHMRAMLALFIHRTEGDHVALHHAFMHDMRFAPAFAYLDRVMEQGNPRKAWKLLTKAWKTQPHALLAERVVRFSVQEKPEQRMKRAYMLYNMHPHHLESQLLMAHVACDVGKWESADMYVRAAEHYAPQQRVVALRHALVRHGYGEAWSSIIMPDPTWHCDACGTIHEVWDSHCSHCHSFDRMIWGVPQPKANDMMPMVW
ncbi:MAG: hypothetical protein EAZ74_01585 [Alphaproteobacteria bacterium]|nr:MAG: hypothetical protein EAY76_06715 [Alphaproteobacteria bacterium]TAF15486.1 MAG: hypothetical protein EAZ74_01585 [Alphaproteobacteria bacterium]